MSNNVNFDKVLKSYMKRDYKECENDPFYIKNDGMDFATIGQNFEDYQYTYHEGYYLAVKSIFFTLKKGISNDSDSLIIPTIYLIRHYLEIVLKDSIFYLKLLYGLDIKINEKLNHDLKTLLDKFLEVLQKVNIKSNSTVKKFIKCVNKYVTKNDQFRYPTSIDGDFNLPIVGQKSIKLKDLEAIFDYVHSYFSNIFLIISGDETAYLYQKKLDNPYIIGLIKKISSENIKQFTIGSVNNILKGYSKKYVEEENTCKFNAQKGVNKSSINININGKHMLTILSKDGQFFIKSVVDK